MQETQRENAHAGWMRVGQCTDDVSLYPGY